MTTPTGPLSDVVVLDLTHARAGPACSRHLADWGAQVIKIEQPIVGPDKGEVTGRRHSPDFQNLNRNKKSVVIDLKSGAGRTLFMKMVEKADVVLENMRVDVKHRLGIDYETLRKCNNRIVYGSISGFGQTGPYAKRPGLDQVAQGWGLMSVTGLPGAGPTRVGAAVCDLSAGSFLAVGVLAALHACTRTGEGSNVTTSLLETVISLLDFQAARWLVKGELPEQEGNFHPTGAPIGLFETLDGKINFSASRQHQFEAMCPAIDAPELAADPRFATTKLRERNRDELHRLIGEKLRLRTTDHWLEVLPRADIPCGPLYDVRQVFEDPQVRHLDMVKPLAHPIMGDIQLIAQPMSISGYSRDIRAPVSEAGGDADAILAEFGIAGEDVAALRRSGAIR